MFLNRFRANETKEAVDKLLKYAGLIGVQYDISGQLLNGITVINADIHYGEYSTEIAQVRLEVHDKIEDFIETFYRALPTDQYYMKRTFTGSYQVLKYGEGSHKEMHSSAEKLSDRMRGISQAAGSAERSSVDILAKNKAESVFKEITRKFENIAATTGYTAGQKDEVELELKDDSVYKMAYTKREKSTYGYGVFKAGNQCVQSWRVTPTRFGVVFTDALNEHCRNENVKVKVFAEASVFGGSWKTKFPFAETEFVTDWMSEWDNIVFSLVITAQITY